MNKILFNLIVLLGLSAIASSQGVVNAQICKIDVDNSSVEVFSCYLSDGNAVVILSNDSDNIKANVTVTVEVVYSINISRSYTGKILANPGSTELKIPIEAKVNQQTPKSVTVTSISGAKCL